MLEGVLASTIAYNISETAKANDLKPFQHFEHLLTELLKQVEEIKINLSLSMLWLDQLTDNCKFKNYKVKVAASKEAVNFSSRPMVYHLQHLSIHYIYLKATKVAIISLLSKINSISYLYA